MCAKAESSTAPQSYVMVSDALSQLHFFYVVGPLSLLAIKARAKIILDYQADDKYDNLPYL